MLFVASSTLHLVGFAAQQNNALGRLNAAIEARTADPDGTILERESTWSVWNGFLLLWKGIEQESTAITHSTSINTFFYHHSSWIITHSIELIAFELVRF
jgi:hypothetical protein